MGDAIMAFWNAPLDDPDHARNSAMAALAMRAELAKLNARWQSRSGGAARAVPRGALRGRAQHGYCCVGNLGSARRFDYSAIGDDVNVASRLEGATKFLGVDIAANEATRDEAPELAWLEIDTVMVKGKTLPITAYTLVGDEAVARTEGFKALARRHEAMLDAFRGRAFDEALELAEEADALAPAEIAGLYKFYRTRIMEVLESAPGEEWSPVLTLEEK